MNAPPETALAAYRARLEALYGTRLQRLVLFGSRARGDADPDSDIDVMIVLEGPIDRWQETQRTSEITSDVSIQFNTDVSRLFATPEEAARSSNRFFETVRREGVAVGPAAP